MTPIASYDQFLALDIRVGTVVSVDPFPEARKPAWKLTIDFGEEIGLKRSSAQITDLYGPETLVGRQVCCAINLGNRQIGPFISEILTLGFTDTQGRVVLIQPERPVANGGRLH